MIASVGRSAGVGRSDVQHEDLLKGEEVAVYYYTVHYIAEASVNEEEELLFSSS